MKVEFKHGETTRGIFKKTTIYTVEVLVTFTEEEKEALKGQEDMVVYSPGVPSDYSDYQGDPHNFDVTVKELMNQSSLCFMTASSRVEAKTHEQKITNELHILKRFIDENKEIEEKHKSFEL